MEQDDIYVLDTIKANSSDIVECCSKMFTEWHQRKPKASWKHLIEALKEVELTQLACEVEKLLISSVECCVQQEDVISQQHLGKLLPLQKSEGIVFICLICH